MPSDANLVLSTVPDAATAARIAETLVAERLAACVNALPGVLSTYRWQGAVRNDTEVLLIAKTDAAHRAALIDRLVELHPYELPEVIALPVVDGSTAYLDWIRSEVS